MPIQFRIRFFFSLPLYFSFLPNLLRLQRHLLHHTRMFLSLQEASLSNKCCLIPPFSPGAVTQIPNLHEEKLAPENFRLDNQTGRLPKQGHDAGRGRMSQKSPGIWPSQWPQPGQVHRDGLIPHSKPKEGISHPHRLLQAQTKLEGCSKSVAGYSK